MFYVCVCVCIYIYIFSCMYNIFLQASGGKYSYYQNKLPTNDTQGTLSCHLVFTSILGLIYIL